MAIFGYIGFTRERPGPIDQTALLEAAGCIQVFAEKDGPGELAKALNSLREGDTLIVMQLDHLARSTPSLYKALQAISNAGASFRSLGDPWADMIGTRGQLILSILGGIADFEAGLIKARIATAKANGVKLGRRLVLSSDQRQEVLQRVARGETQRSVALSLGVSESAVSSVVRGARSRLTTDRGVRRRARLQLQGNDV